MNFWIGLSTVTNGATWKWVDGSDFSYTNWEIDQPDSVKENCVFVSTQSTVFV